MLRKWLLITALSTIAAAPAFAGPQLTIIDVSVQGDDVFITGPISGETIAGPITVNTTLGTFIAFCVDLYHDIYVGNGQNLHYQIGTVTSNFAPTPTTLSAQQAKQIANLVSYGQSILGTPDGTNDNLASVQLAIWSVGNPDLTYTGGSGTSISNAITQSNLHPGFDTGLLALEGTQTLATANPFAVTADQAIPEPAALPLIGGALAMLGLARRR